MMNEVAQIDVREFIHENQQMVERILDNFLPDSDSGDTLLQAMRYSLMAGGKRLRPILAKAAFDYCHGDSVREKENLERAMAALEMVHTYSLIHDDLPCMDDDDLRRGIPTCHKKFGEAAAVLAGDALHDIAFKLLAETGRAEAVMELADAIGVEGMIGGQMADIEAEGAEIDQAQIESIHRRKTAALIRCSIRLGAIFANADTTALERLNQYGARIGLAFQIIDDILDIEGDQELLGKNVGSDSNKEKATYPKAIGTEQAKAEAERLINEAIESLNDSQPNILNQIARYIGQRNS